MKENLFDVNLTELESHGHKNPAGLIAAFVSLFFVLNAKESRVSVWFKGIVGSPRYGRIGRILNSWFYFNANPEPIKAFTADVAAMKSFDDTLTRYLLLNENALERAVDIIKETVTSPAAPKEAKETAARFFAHLKSAVEKAKAAKAAKAKATK